MACKSLGITINAVTVPYPHEQVPFDEPQPVRARIVWYRIGEQWFDAIATATSPELIKVEIDDERLAGHEVWLRPEDLQRREEPSEPAPPAVGSEHVRPLRVQSIRR